MSYEKMPIRLVCFDFDDTLLSYRKDLSTVLPPGSGDRWFLDRVFEARRNCLAFDTFCTLLTARRTHLDQDKLIPAICAASNLDFDAIQLKPEKIPLSDALYKAGAVIAWVQRYPTIKSVTFYDDRRENLRVVGEAVAKLGRSYRPILTRGTRDLEYRM